VIFDLFNELQRPAPFSPEHEHLALLDGIEQAKAADRAGFGCWWMVEHHGSTEFSYSSAPELVLTAIAQHTERLRLGHAGVLSPFKINHPVRVAERAAVLDHLSGGRLEFGLARSGGTEWETFGITAERTRDELTEAFHAIPKMWTEDTFSWDSELLRVPPRNIVPKPMQQPHPPLWQTSSTLDSFRLAGQMGIGVLATTLLAPMSKLTDLMAAYDQGLAEASDPVGKYVNNQRAVFTFVHVAETMEEAIMSGAAEAAMWYVNAAPQVFSVPRKLWLDSIRGLKKSNDVSRARAVATREEVIGEVDLDDPHPVIRLMNRLLVGEKVDPHEAFEVLRPLDSVIIGDPTECRRKIQKFVDIGIDRLMCLMQFGALSHEQVMRSIELTGKHLVPAYAPALA